MWKSLTVLKSKRNARGCKRNKRNEDEDVRGIVRGNVFVQLTLYQTSLLVGLNLSLAFGDSRLLLKSLNPFKF